MFFAINRVEIHHPSGGALELCLQLHKQSLDTKALLAWNDDTVVLSFRGTASLKNVFAGVPLFAKLKIKTALALLWPACSVALRCVILENPLMLCLHSCLQLKNGRVLHVQWRSHDSHLC